ncbi:MAG: monovalent cation/H+ antiporter subunit D family protein [Nitrospirota bacterium]
MTELFAIEYRPWLAILCPTIASLLIILSGRRPNLRESWTMIGSVLLFLTVISMTPFVLKEGHIRCSLFNLLPGVDFALDVDAFGLIFATTSSCLWILVSLFSIGYMRSLEEHAQTRYYFCFALALLGAIGVALSANLVTMFVFYEILTISTYPLVAHEETPEAIYAGHKYLAYLLTGGLFFLFGILMTYLLVGTTDFSHHGILKPALGSTSKLVLQIVFFCFMVGFMKAAWMPVHSWLPTAMAAPTPVSALLHAVAVVKAGVFGIIKIVFYLYGIDLMRELGLGVALGCVAAFTVIVANLYAIGQDNLKRRLAYSTINQLSFILLGAALLSPMGTIGAMIHIPFHGFMKITLFLCAGAIAVIAGKKNVSELAGVGRIMPVTMMAFTVTAAGMCSIPPLAGFISKWYFCLGSIQSGAMVFLFVALAASVLDFVYFFPIVRNAFFERPAETRGGGTEIRRKETGRPIYLFMVIPLAITGIFSIILCLFPNMFHIFDLAQMAVRNLFGGV